MAYNTSKIVLKSYSVTGQEQEEWIINIADIVSSGNRMECLTECSFNKQIRANVKEKLIDVITNYSLVERLLR